MGSIYITNKRFGLLLKFGRFYLLMYVFIIIYFVEMMANGNAKVQF